MNGTKRLLAGLSALALVLAACGDDSGDGGEVGDLELVTPGTLTVCTDVPFPPMEFEDSNSELGYDGFDIELSAAVAAELGLDVTVATPGWDAITGGLAFENDDCDVAAASITITPEREENIDFSDPYFNGEQSLLVKKDSGITGWADMQGKSVSVQTGTTGAIYAEENGEGVEVVTFEDAAGPYLALDAGEVDAVLFDLVANQGVADEDDTVQVVETFSTDEEYGLATKDSPNLLAAINGALATLREDGTYDEIHEKWFPGA
jgi:polar amino acid transport system substrate-binding protein